MSSLLFTGQNSDKKENLLSKYIESLKKKLNDYALQREEQRIEIERKKYLDGRK